MAQRAADAVFAPLKHRPPPGPPPRARPEELVPGPGGRFLLRSTDRQTLSPPTGTFNFVRVHGEAPRARPVLVSSRLAHAQLAAGRPVVYAGAARFERGEMAWWSNYSGTYQPIAAFRAQAGLPEDKFVPWQKLQMGGVAMQRGTFTERRTVTSEPAKTKPAKVIGAMTSPSHEGVAQGFLTAVEPPFQVTSVKAPGRQAAKPPIGAAGSPGPRCPATENRPLTMAAPPFGRFTASLAAWSWPALPAAVRDRLDLLARGRQPSGGRPLQASAGTPGPRPATGLLIQRMEKMDVEEFDGTGSEDEDRLESARARVGRTNSRNKFGKSAPTSDRTIFDVQSSSSYGYGDTHFDVGGQSFGYKKGYGAQPFMFGGVNYDQLVAAMQRGGPQDEMYNASALLAVLEEDESLLPFLFSGGEQKAAGEFVALTQVIESHESRFPGADKLARALLRAIKKGQSTFAICFNRRNGLYLPAWRKSAGAPCGGQEAMRIFLGQVRKKADNKKLDISSIIALVSELPRRIEDNFSESSGDEF